MPAINAFHARDLVAATILLLVLLALSACATRPEPVDDGLAQTDQILLQSLPSRTISYEESVRPVLQRRCVCW